VITVFDWVTHRPLSGNREAYATSLGWFRIATQLIMPLAFFGATSGGAVAAEVPIRTGAGYAYLASEASLSQLAGFDAIRAKQVVGAAEINRTPPLAAGAETSAALEMSGQVTFTESTGRQWCAHILYIDRQGVGGVVVAFLTIDADPRRLFHVPAADLIAGCSS
jgi:hypothetical protein